MSVDWGWKKNREWSASVGTWVRDEEGRGGRFDWLMRGGRGKGKGKVHGGKARHAAGKERKWINRLVGWCSSYCSASDRLLTPADVRFRLRYWQHCVVKNQLDLSDHTEKVIFLTWGRQTPCCDCVCSSLLSPFFFWQIPEVSSLGGDYLITRGDGRLSTCPLLHLIWFDLFFCFFQDLCKGLPRSNGPTGRATNRAFPSTPWIANEEQEISISYLNNRYDTDTRRKLWRGFSSVSIFFNLALYLSRAHSQAAAMRQGREEQQRSREGKGHGLVWEEEKKYIEFGIRLWLASSQRSRQLFVVEKQGTGLCVWERKTGRGRWRNKVQKRKDERENPIDSSPSLFLCLLKTNWTMQERERNKTIYKQCNAIREKIPMMTLYLSLSVHLTPIWPIETEIKTSGAGTR